MRNTTAESDPDVGLLTQQTFSFSPDVLDRANKMSLVTLPVASYLG